MAALTNVRDTLYYEIDEKDWLPVAAGVRLWAGGIVAVNAAGYAVPGATSTTIKTAGRAEFTVDNLLGAAGDAKVEIRRAGFLYANSAGGDALTIADRYNLCYLVDDQTVAKTDGGATRVKAGRVIRVGTEGVWVYINPLVG